MTSSLPVLRLVVDGGILHFNLANTQISLKIRHVIVGIPKAKLNQGKKGHGFGPPRFILKHDPHHFAVKAEGNKKELLHPEPTSRSLNHGVAQAMAALVEGQLLFHRLET